ncbi:cation:proton antiporter [Brochothrix thermosphacta]|uniref:cation:proton antiporter n=1 Tax=Brochothrix thermosphacta TaxID=2756 RepID=UPI000D7A2E5C|nr:cation:proton antiporter [Brochothrix thermosphacta]SPN74344.1 putative Na(+)/H(+) antiporter GerT [Brochothrix thermosphacta]
MLLFQLVVILAAAKLCGHLAVRIGQPGVLGELIAGILIGPAVLNIVTPSELITVLSEIGVILLMFFAGLETDLKELNRYKYPSIMVAAFGVIFPMVAGFMIGEFAGMNTVHSLFLGLVFAATSVSISVQTFKELGEFSSKESVTVLGAAILDDIIAIVGLSILIGFMSSGDTNLWPLFGKFAVFIAFSVLAWRGLPWLMKILTRLRVYEPRICAAILACFTFAFVAEELGLSAIIGSFMAGLILAKTDLQLELQQKIEPLAQALIIPVFFASIGLSMQLDGLKEHIWLVVILCVMAVFTKIIGSGIGALLTGFKPKSALIVGTAMMSRGEVALILAALGLQQALFPEVYYAPILIAIIFSTVLTPVLLKYFIHWNRKA